ncbi:hypothetical protein A2841_01405 [Candidatus Kaiserbacteria bacterium RIFCSPHIGHO2_01_FULL_48_10]|uniref:Uncharacterized protein n=1 Tax=Candidatus Kaiserbacteria bacterium RIFCSPHIGHO2_01_FULL_48_10 TaxID=1798476 RepID=A0A1F6C5B4_9BACT|nr:MAG: hypothetical protein A2841_01405 [Candidatus Kaiserbacteria bacterium RIFCSPHIGHO2_01_FULL_48_10]
MLLAAFEEASPKYRELDLLPSPIFSVKMEKTAARKKPLRVLLSEKVDSGKIGFLCLFVIVATQARDAIHVGNCVQ